MCTYLFYELEMLPFECCKKIYASDPYNTQGQNMDMKEKVNLKNKKIKEQLSGYK